MNCGLGSLSSNAVTPDGVSQAALGDAQLYVSSEHQMLQRVNTPLIDQMVVNLTLYGDQHPFPTGFNTFGAFDTAACTAR